MKGITPNMPPEQYFAIPAMNQSTLKKALVNSEELQHAIKGGVNVTEDMLWGTAFHTALIEPERFKAYFKVWKKQPKKSTAAFMEDLNAARVEGFEMYRSDWDIDTMVNAVKRHPEASAILECPGGQCELSLVWDREGVPAKCRLDGVWLEHGVVVDVKTTRDVETRDIESESQYRGYFFQAAYGIEGLRALTGRQDWKWYHVWVKKDAPHTVRVTVVHPSAIEHGRLMVQRAWGIWRGCVNSGAWTAYPTVDEIVAQPWAMNELSQAYESGEMKI